VFPRWKPLFRKLFEKNGEDDETRTRDLCRDSAAGIGFATYKTHGDCQTQRKSDKSAHFVGWVVGRDKPSFDNHISLGHLPVGSESPEHHAFLGVRS
jgi:hypothetical protein